MSEQLLFKEKQKLSHWWVWAVMLGTLGFIFWACWVLIVRGNLLQGLIPVAILLLIILWLAVIELKTTISTREIHAGFSWLPASVHIPWDEVENAEIVKYQPVLVGYGLRWTLKYGIVYNINGNMGLLLTLKNGKKRMIGTQQPEGVIQALKHVSGLSFKEGVIPH